MSDVQEVMPGLDLVLGSEGWRARGISSWDDVARLGRANLRSLRTWAELATNRALADQDRAFLTEARPILARLVEFADRAEEEKPLLPRLRRESFRLHEDVAIYVGELPGATSRWAHGSITLIEKAFNADWKGPEAGSGYYWRVTAHLRTGAPPKFSVLRFSTSEPRVMPESDFLWLRSALSTERRFVEVFAENCRREWQPLWCIEAGMHLDDPAAMNVMEWLAAG